MRPSEAFAWLASVGIGATILSVGIGALSLTLRQVWKSWTTKAPHQTCGVIERADNRPCVLALGHREHEHATAWLDADEDNRMQARYRWDGVDPLGREEHRWKPEYLPKFTPSGERA